MRKPEVNSLSPSLISRFHGKGITRGITMNFPNGASIAPGPDSNSAGSLGQEHKSWKSRLRPEEDDEPQDWWFASIAIPLLAATIGPLANLLSIAALVTPWRNKFPDGSERHDNESKGFPDPHCSMVLMINMLGYFLGHYPQHFTLTDHQRTLMLQTMMFFIWLGGGAAVFARVCHWSYVDSIYFCDVTILTVGFGDLFPINDTGRGLVFPFSVGGIVILGLVVNSIRQFTLDLSKDKVIKRHVEKTRIRTIGRAATASLEIRERRSSVGPFNSRVAGDTVLQKRRITFQGSEKLPRPGSLKKRLTNGVLSVTRVRSKKPKIVLLKAERDRFNAMREIQRSTKVFKRWYNLCISVFAFGLLWCVGAIVFWKAEHREQNMTYFKALYFCYVSLLTIGYGDLSPKSNAGKPFFLVWSLIAVPTMTILISDMGQTVIASFQRGTFHLADWTVLPKAGLWPNFLRKNPWLLLWIQRKIEQKAAEKRVAEGFQTGIEDVDGVAPRTLEELAQDETGVEDLPRDLALAIRRVASHLRVTPPQRYSYEEWAQYTRLIRFSSMSLKEVEEDEEEEGLINWDWMGEDSPMLSESTETEWLLDRLCESLTRYMKSQTQRAHDRGSRAVADGEDKGCDGIGPVDRSEAD
ncbi:hypothetical protein FGG08_006428 [Glutinoglossum americanum]|uniref:Potassium channel domain-containing protein n=1 Tax=Glutinoglossum americanum TaxID=1670608 RepID=A0A9P8HW27_9PEZI|nr:hypothetical protein FGG08_006428 [Glutinoglossum americanum]